MARPRTPISSHGAIAVQEVAPGKWRARARYRFENGALRQVERFAPTKAKARNALQTALTKMTASAGVDVKRETTLGDLADRFLQSKADRAPRTVETYEQTIRHLIKPNLGEVSVVEATTDRMQRFIDKVAAENGAGAAKISRTVLSGMLGLAARSDAIRSNPIRELARISRPGQTHGAEPVPLEELPKLLAKVRADERLRFLDMVDLIEFLAGTGCRIGEACGLAWEDVDLQAGTVTVKANVVRATGRGLIRQDHTKTKAGLRTIRLPASLMGILGDRRIHGENNALVFPTVLGHMRDPRATQKDWAEARVRLGFPGVSTHSFRKTVATALDQAGLSARDIAEYLGHANPSLTQDVYMAKNIGGKRAADALEKVLS